MKHMNLNIWDKWCHLCSCLHVHTWPTDHCFTLLHNSGHCARLDVNIWNKWCYTELTWRWQSTPQSLMTDEKGIMKFQRNLGIYCCAQLWVLNEVYKFQSCNVVTATCDIHIQYLANLIVGHYALTSLNPLIGPNPAYKFVTTVAMNILKTIHESKFNNDGQRKNKVIWNTLRIM